MGGHRDVGGRGHTRLPSITGVQRILLSSMCVLSLNNVLGNKGHVKAPVLFHSGFQITTRLSRRAQCAHGRQHVIAFHRFPNIVTLRRHISAAY